MHHIGRLPGVSLVNLIHILYKFLWLLKKKKTGRPVTFAVYFLFTRGFVDWKYQFVED